MEAEEKDLILDVQLLAALPDLAVVLDAPWDSDDRGMVYEKSGDDCWYTPGSEEEVATSQIRLPARILYLP